MMYRCIAMLLLLVASFVHAADFSTGAEAYARGDYEGAFLEWRVLARQGDVRAQYRLAQMYADGIGVAEDDEEALHWFRQAADQGSLEAQSELALMYSLGRGVRRDHTRAAYWYARLADAGHATAQYLLGVMHEDGTGVERDASRAFFWYRRAAEQGFVGAQVKLGEMYSQGRGVSRDLARAWAWFDRAAARGHDGAAERRAELGRLIGEKALAGVTEPGSAPTARASSPPERRNAREPDLVAAPEMVRLESGCFAMGSDSAEDGRHGDEVRHSVCVEDFSISRHEVTRGQYAAFVEDTGRSTSDGCRSYGNGGWASRAGRSWRDPGFAQGDDHPVACVSRDDALAYVAWISKRLGRSYRLPTEAEWEYAARAGADSARPWGDDSGDACLRANVGDRALFRHYPGWPWTIHPCDDTHAHTAPVGSFRTNGYGLHDMLGNVWEWTCSSYDAAYRGAERRCDSRSGNGVVRGGSWSNSPRWVRSAGRFRNRPETRLDLVGFRLVHD